MNGSIAIVAASGGCALERHIEVAQEAGAVGVIIISEMIWKSCNFVDKNTKSFNNQIPAVCITAEDSLTLTSIIANNSQMVPPQPALVSFTADTNTFLAFNSAGMNFLTIFFFIAEVLVFFGACYKIVRFLKVQGPRFTAAQILLWITAFSDFFFLTIGNFFSPLNSKTVLPQQLPILICVDGEAGSTLSSMRSQTLPFSGVQDSMGLKYYLSSFHCFSKKKLIILTPFQVHCSFLQHFTHCLKDLRLQRTHKACNVWACLPALSHKLSGEHGLW